MSPSTASGQAEANNDPEHDSQAVAHSTNVQGDPAADKDAPSEERQSLASHELIEQLNRGYICPPEAGPAWRAAHEAGVDMGLLEDALQMTPEKRLHEHQRALNLVLSLTNTRLPHDSGS